MANPVTYDIALLSNGDMSSNITSNVIEDLQSSDNFGIQLNFTGTPTGTFAVQCSGDYLPGTGGTVIRTGNWVTLPVKSSTGTSPTAAGNADVHFININNSPAPFLRVVYTATSGTGTLDIWVSAKGL